MELSQLQQQMANIGVVNGQWAMRHINSDYERLTEYQSSNLKINKYSRTSIHSSSSKMDICAPWTTCLAQVISNRP